MTSPDLSPSAPRSCPAGHLQADPSARFCLECGAAMDASEAPPAPHPVAACAAHPEAPTSTACPRCGTFACEACLRTLPDRQVVCFRCADREAQVLPWDRPEIGRLRAFWRTSLLILQKPGATFASAQPHGSTGSSLWFSVLANVAGSITTLALYVAIFGIAVLVAMMSPDAQTDAGEVTAVLVGVTLAMLLLFPLVMVGYTLMRAGMDHLLLRIIRAHPAPFEVTLRAHSLSIAPALVGLIPLCGIYVWPIWSVVLRVFAYRGLHRISTGQAAFAALFFPVLGTVVSIAAYVALIAFSIAQTPS